MKGIAMVTIAIRDIEQHISALLPRVQSGRETIEITGADQVVVRIVPAAPEPIAPRGGDEIRRIWEARDKLAQWPRRSAQSGPGAFRSKRIDAPCDRRRCTCVDQSARAARPESPIVPELGDGLERGRKNHRLACSPAGGGRRSSDT